MMEPNLGELSSQSCVVKVKFPNLETELSGCGTILYPSHGIVISHGSILIDYIITDRCLLSKVKNGKVIKDSDLLESDFNLLLSNQSLSSNSSQDAKMSNTLVVGGVSSSNLVGKRNVLSDFTSVKCNFLGAFRNHDFHNTVSQMMPSNGWTLGDTSSDIQTIQSDVDNQNRRERDDQDASYHLISYFLVLRFNPLDVANLKSSSVVSQTKTRNMCRIGDTAEIIATPFAALCPSVFYNTYSRGVISNISGNKNCWIVTDARCIPGCEGGPLYTKMKQTDVTSYLTGIIASSLCWKNNEWIGFSVVCGIGSIVESMALQQETLMGKRHINLSSLKKRIYIDKDEADQGQAVTVLIQCGSTWGTGVIVDRDQGIILTCSHVLKDADYNTVMVRHSKNKSKYPVEIIHRQTSGTTPYDIAVVKCQDASKHLPQGWSIPVSPAVVGEEVILCGHAVFRNDLGLQPSVFQGVVSKVVKYKQVPALFQTTCAVHAGASGGPLLNSDNCLVGIAVCNTRDSNTNTSFPHVNLCIPITAVWSIILDYLNTGDKKLLRQLKIHDLELKELWALGTQTNYDDDKMHLRSKL